MRFETKKRSVVKSIAYRALASIALAIISWFYTGNVVQASLITIVFTIVATIIYYVYERIWDKISWGRL